ncbi:hypothetical protein FB561_5617 [Kribbella amoyensis]|uniref:Uncharacterized protein n=1 Tax=Kribbella amoyensis TaxID=996641 RepID=A0A561C002_9ACTN|nr:hypothetical protein [Kribbella amoyensis]TWD84430.1 hypothetical protein FB561_5617 [Kribbella amoyensis]
MADEIDQAVLAQARQTLADWVNENADEDDERMDADSFAGWQAGTQDEFFVFTSPGGYTNMLYLVGEGVVHPFSYATETLEYAVAAARAERDGTEPPERPGPAITWENWNEE